MYAGPLLLCPTDSVFRLKADLISKISLRVSQCSMPAKDAERYGVKLVKSVANLVYDSEYLIPAESCFKLVVKSHHYQLEWTQKLNPNGPYNFVVRTKELVLPAVERIV